MAMLQIGKLKFRFKDGGLDYRWGDGEKRRIGLRRKPSEGENAELYPEDYVENTDASDLDYDGRFSGADEDYDAGDYDDYADDGYEDQPYDGDPDEGYGDRYDDEYGDEPYDEDDGDGEYYDDERYEDERYDDDYDRDDRYDDDYAEDGEYDSDYDDRYYDEDADGGYVEYPEGSLGTILQYVDENDWVTYLLLVLLPPLGIYLLWRRQRFNLTVRYGLSAASAVWFVALIVLIVMFGFGGRGDREQNPGLVMPSVSPSASADIEATPTPDVSTTPTVEPSATPVGGASAVPSSNVVYASADGNFYHNKNDCELIAPNETVTQVTLENAKSRGKYACPYCYGGDLYFATSGGRYYHLDYKCSGMSNPELYSKEKAEAEGKPACPVCVSKQRDSLYNTDNVTFITASTTDRSGLQLWWTSNGTYYHMTSGCSGMSGASRGSLRDALLYGKQACPTCCALGGTMVWCTKNGKSYHVEQNCSGMENASQVTLAEALVLGKSRCYVCQPDTSTPGGGNQTGTYYVYATPNGQYYHIDEHCSGMTDAVQVPLSKMLEINRPACPTCCSGADMTIYASENGTYYHSYATCSGMTNAVQSTLANALARGYQRCPRCWGENGSTNEGSGSGNTASTITADNIMVYATQNGQHYHTLSTCSGMTNASYIPLRVAIQAGKTACSNCAAAAQTMVYSTDGGTYFHKTADCSGMQNARRRTLADALMLNQQPCPVCSASASTTMPTVTASPQQGGEVDPSGAHYDEFTVGTSGIKVYASPTEEYYHTRSNCSGKSGLTQVALEVALNYGKSACPVCAASAESVVYATANGRYYHISQSCAGEGAVAGTLAYALAYGFTPCPYCVTGAQQNAPAAGSGTYTIGTSGVKVYAHVNGTYYHASQSHAESGAVQVTLETAMNYGKLPCPECCALASRTVYAVPNTTYYHSNRSCAGSNAVAGTFAQALAMGLKPCPNCIGTAGNIGNATAPSAGAEYNAPASTVVYVDLYSDQFYYHKSSSCSGAGMTNGTPQTLEFAKDLGYYRCPYCNPASGIG